MSKRDDILASALRIVTAEGIRSLTMAKIQEKAHVGSGTMYNYFGGKEKLLHELYERAMSRMNELIMGGYTATGNVRVDFDELMMCFLQYGVSCFDELNFTDQYSFFIRDEFQKEHMKKPNRVFQASESILQSGQNQRIIKSIDITVLQRIVSGIIIAVAQSVYLHDLVLNDELTRDIITACWDAVKA
ncbi:HTH-type transcriptional repressor FatR [Spirochaetia bacterium]|nr:HTH-type transcriptional repressor FatR [Spirochaetia bacterium]